jgi:hypothetical protein
LDEFTMPTGKKMNNREECHWSHEWQRFKRSKSVKLNGILECKFLSKKRAPCVDNLLLAAAVRGSGVYG